MLTRQNSALRHVDKDIAQLIQQLIAFVDDHTDGALHHDVNLSLDLD